MSEQKQTKNPDFAIIGKGVPMIDGTAKVTGTAMYADDMKLPGMLYGKILRKRRAHISSLDVTVEGSQADQPPWSYERVALHFRIGGEGLRVPVMARVIRLSIVRYCSVIMTIAGVAAIEATVELVAPEGTTTGAQMIELAIPYAPPPSADLEEVGVAEPLADED